MRKKYRIDSFDWIKIRKGLRNKRNGGEHVFAIIHCEVKDRGFYYQKISYLKELQFLVLILVITKNNFEDVLIWMIIYVLNMWEAIGLWRQKKI